MKHKHILKNAPEKEKAYRVEYQGEELYDARVLEYDGGCWAKIRIEKIFDGDKAGMYKVGQEFDLKLAYYKLYELESTE